MRLLGDISRLNAKRFPDKHAFRCSERVLSFTEANTLANRVANRLLATGVRRGDRIAMLSPNCAEYIPIFFGIVKAGAVCVPLNCRSTPNELGHFLSNCAVRTLIFAPEFSDIVNHVRTQSPVLQSLIATGLAPMVADAVDLTAFAAPASGTEPTASVDEMDDAAIFYTSGTTGRAKGAVFTHRALLDGTRETVLVARIRHDDAALVSIPLFHGGGLMVLSMPHLYVGASLEIMAKFNPTAALDLITEQRLTTFLGVAAQYRAMLDVPEPERFHASALRNMWYGAAPMPPELLKRCIARWPSARFFQSYGQTETTLIAALYPEDHRARVGMTGRALPGVEVRILSEDGKDVTLGGVGEVVVRAENGMKEYFGDPEETVKVLRNGWICTGDLARVEEAGYFTLVDRKRDVIVSGGENIYPKEIENILYEHPDIKQAAVIGVSDTQWGEVPSAYIVLNAEATVSAMHLVDWCACRLARYKIPKRWTFVDALPMNAFGKVQKNVLKHAAADNG